MTDHNLIDKEADRLAAIDAKSDALWGNHPDLVIQEAGGAQWLLEQYMSTLDADWLKKRLVSACDRLAAKGDL